MTDLILHQFPFSHFNEKARWALDFKGLAHHRESYLPGPHMPQIKKLSGQPQTPVLQHADTIVPGSADIIDYLEQHFPNNPLYPTSPENKTKALELCRYFDTEVGPATRTVLFSAMVHEGSYMTQMFGSGKSALKKAAYRATYPLVKGLVAKGNGVNPENIRYSRDVVQSAMSKIEAFTADGDYLVGEQFSVADLTAAALFAPLAGVDHEDMKRPQPVPASIQAIIDEYQDSPTIAWVNRIYQQHR